MKVLNVVDGLGWTGGVEQTMLLAAALREMGVDATLAAHAGNPVLDESRDRGIPAFPYDEGEGRRRRSANLRRLLNESYDAVIGHKPAAVRHLMGPLFLRRGRPLFLGVRRVSFPVSPLTVYRLPDHVVAVSESVKDVLVGSGLKRAVISVIPSGVETEKFRRDDEAGRLAREEMGLSGKTVLLNLAKFVPAQKGQHILFQALSALEDRRDIVLLMAGLETDSEPARKLVAEYGLEETVTLLGFRRDIPNLINASDLFVFPSLPGLDAIAGSVLQAMATEKLVVASSVGGIPEYLRDGSNGFLVRPGDAAGLKRAIADAVAMSSGERSAIGAEARKTVVGRYSVTAMGRDYFRLIEDLGGKRK